jgi:hypothetical protein
MVSSARRPARRRNEDWGPGRHMHIQYAAGDDLAANKAIHSIESFDWTVVQVLS